MNNTGSFGSPAGGVSQELADAISRRQQPQGGATNAVTMGSASFDPNTQPQSPITAPVPGSPPPSGAVPGQTGAPVSPGESVIIIKAMQERLKSLSKIQEAGGVI